MRFIFIIFLITFKLSVFAQERVISGNVFTFKSGKKTSVPFANVWLKNTTNSSLSDTSGRFKLTLKESDDNYIIVSAIDFVTDTIFISDSSNYLEIVLDEIKRIDEVVIETAQRGTSLSKSAIQTEKINTSGLQRLACCNLSESFENNATVDVGYTDAVTGAKQIQMLGLSGIYSQVLTENLPGIRGLAAPFGLSYIPGSWMEAINISKGTSSVLYGYESITGQINVEFRHPHESEPFHINIYGNSDGRVELTSYATYKKLKKWKASAMAHVSGSQYSFDHNDDGFIDVPIGQQLNFLVRASYDNSSHIESKTLARILIDDRNGGQNEFIASDKDRSSGFYGTQLATMNGQVFNKTGFNFKKREATSIGFINSFGTHQNTGYFGNRNYSALQNTYYSNLIFQTYLVSTNSTINAGLSFQLDDMSEELDSIKLKRTEEISGVFMQYSYVIPEKFNVIAGLRVDYNSFYGVLYTPRLHVKYSITDHLSIRGSAGRGYRSAYVFADNFGVLSSSRNLVIQENPELERAWNFGTNISYHLPMSSQREFELSLEAYQTIFDNQFIADMDASPQYVYYYNSSKKSYSQSMQAQIVVNPIKSMDITVAYRYNIVKNTLKNGLTDKAFMPKYRALVSWSYSTKHDKWQFDLSANLIGPARIPSTDSNIAEYRIADTSDEFVNMFGQVTRRFKNLSIYMGCENITNFIQKDPIIASDDPFGKYFDASMIWGPITGRMFYGGIRYTINN